jgi:hypothetical protein
MSLTLHFNISTGIFGRPQELKLRKKLMAKMAMKRMAKMTMFREENLLQI